MTRSVSSHYGRSHKQYCADAATSRIPIAQRRARRARKQLLKLFPHLAPRLHKGVSAASIYQHAATLAQAPPGYQYRKPENNIHHL